VLAVVIALLAAACGGLASTISPTDGPTPTLIPTVPGATAEPTAPRAAQPGPAAFADAPTGCLGLDEASCAEVSAVVAEQVPAEAAILYVEIGPFGCAVPGPDGAPCPPTLADRPAGFASVELAAGEPIVLAVSTGPEGITAAREEPFRVALPPSSPRAVVGQVPYSLGHCGLGSGIDIDGSWWDPVGFVDIDHPDAINAASATVTSTGRDTATLRTDGGLVVALVRHPGPKSLPLCM
jgi:hypothetical protein